MLERAELRGVNALIVYETAIGSLHVESQLRALVLVEREPAVIRDWDTAPWLGFVQPNEFVVPQHGPERYGAIVGHAPTAFDVVV